VDYLDEEDGLYAEHESGPMVDDFHVVNGADRHFNGRFTELPQRIFASDGRHTFPVERYRGLAEEIGSHLEEVASGSVFEAMSSVAALRHTVELLEQEIVAYARGEGWSWRDVGDALGVTRSAAQQRFAQVDVAFRRRGA
jgi:hypothetical protein